MERRCKVCCRLIPVEVVKGKSYLKRHPNGGRNCAGSNQKVTYEPQRSILPESAPGYIQMYGPYW